jgi:thioredoxin reductase (NADPH)
VPDILVYTKSYCGYCVWAKLLLKSKNVEFAEVNVSGDRALMQQMIDRSGGRLTAPQIFIGAVHVGGCDELVALDARGELDSLLGKHARDGFDQPVGDDNTNDQADKENVVSENHRPVIILGSGCAGLTAAIYTARANLAPLVISGREFGGQLYTTTDVENFPGFREGIQGPDLIENMKAQAERFGAEIMIGHADKLEVAEQPFDVILEGGARYTCDALIVATGASPKELGVPGERDLRGYGVSTCATCDAAFFRDRPVAVVGGGDSALEEALFLTKFANKVTIIHRRDEFRASPVMTERALAHDSIEMMWNTRVEEFAGSPKTGLQAVRTVHVQTGEEQDLLVDGCFIAIGHDPNTTILHDQGVDFDDLGYVTEGDRPLPYTAIEGVFVAGDIHDHHYRQAVTAAGYGCRAALDAERWLTHRLMGA